MPHVYFAQKALCSRKLQTRGHTQRSWAPPMPTPAGGPAFPAPAAAASHQPVQMTKETQMFAPEIHIWNNQMAGII